jgi:TetR/AcrR family transcriptional regulator, mexCD-oprJ operon repressor
MAVHRQQMLEAAVRVLVENPAASMQVIAAAGVGRASLHRAFPARQDLLRALALDAAAAAEHAISAAAPEAGSAREALGRVVIALLPLGHRYAFLSHDQSFADDPEVRAHARARPHHRGAVRARAARGGDPPRPPAPLDQRHL